MDFFRKTFSVVSKTCTQVLFAYTASYIYSSEWNGTKPRHNHTWLIILVDKFGFSRATFSETKQFLPRYIFKLIFGWLINWLKYLCFSFTWWKLNDVSVSQNDPWDDARQKIENDILTLLKGPYLYFLHSSSSVTEYLASASLPQTTIKHYRQ